MPLTLAITLLSTFAFSMLKLSLATLFLLAALAVFMGPEVLAIAVPAFGGSLMATLFFAGMSLLARSIEQFLRTFKITITVRTN